MTRTYTARFLIALVPTLAFGVALAASAETRDAMTGFFHQSFGDLKEEAETARAEGKLGLFVMFNDPDCPWCHKMKATVLNRPEVQEYYRRHFRPLHIDTRGDMPVIDFSGREMTEKDFAFKRHRVRATPVFIFFDLEGKPVMRYTGATATVEEFLWLGEFIQSGEYRMKNFTVYKRERLAAKRSS